VPDHPGGEQTTRPPASPARFAGAVSVIVGAGSGIGAATARRLASEGAIPVLLDINLPAAEKVAADIPGATAYATDVSDPRAVDATFEAVLTRFGRIDLLAHVAGVDPDMSIKRRIGERLRRASPGEAGGFPGVAGIPDAEWRRMMAVNLDGVFFTNRAAARAMERQRSGVIVNVGSVQGLRGTIGTAHYNASKAGVRLLSQSLALELAGYGVRVNCVAPGPVETTMLERSRAAGVLGPDGGARLTEGLPLRRVARPDEIAAVIAFLMSEDASYIVGETVNVNGGIALL
jgi:NAD(P)-dependent dehydrogenase (short-subunit alcohol dehydrogenase family)